MSIALRSLFIIVTVIAIATPLSAQQVEVEAPVVSEALVEPAVSSSVAAADQTPVASAAALFAPSAASVALMRPSNSVAFDAIPVAMIPRQRTTNNVALMIVGGAGLVVGSVVGGDSGTIIMVGSGVLGLIGLYRYLQ